MTNAETAVGAPCLPNIRVPTKRARRGSVARFEYHFEFELSVGQRGGHIYPDFVRVDDRSPARLDRTNREVVTPETRRDGRRWRRQVFDRETRVGFSHEPRDKLGRTDLDQP